MAEPFMGQLLFAGFNFAPRQYANCDGGLMQVSQFGALFALLGITYGGDGTKTFALPDLRGRSPLGSVASVDVAWSPPRTLPGAIGGSEQVQLTVDQMPSHSHPINVSTGAGDSPSLAGATFATSSTNFYGAAGSLVPLTGSPMSMAGGGAGHSNMQPFTVIEVAIALTGYYPARP